MGKHLVVYLKNGILIANNWAAKASMAALLVMTLVSFLIVVLRYFFGLGWIWLQEVVIYLHAFAFLFAIMKTLEKDDHVRVDIFYNSRSLSVKNLIDSAGFFVLGIPVTLTLLYTSIPYVRDSWKWLEKSADAGGLPFVYILKSLIPLFAFLLFLQGLALTIRRFGKDE